MKKVTSKIKKPNRLHSITNVILIVIFSIGTFSCSNDDDGPPPVVIKEISQEIKDLIYFRGEEKAPTVVITVPGGPGTELATELVDQLSWYFNTTGVLMVNVHQAQTLNPSILQDEDITFDQAVNFNAESVETLHQVVKHFKDEGRTVYVVGLSFGAFMTQELIAKKGIDVADKYLIITGRLDMNDIFWLGLAQGKSGYFENGVNPIINAEPQVDVFGRNEARLFAGLIMNRYTQHFNTIESLSNITYIYGETDDAVGRLTNEEVAFLQSKNANIFTGSGDHDEPYEGYLEQGFNEAFGIEVE